ncbi:MAG: flagellar basal-body rod protein FlgF [Lachnospiraceae bacterium]|nr:flagellar basal-body rod protein FlgF [Lachnospiraceae bacterium]
MVKGLYTAYTGMLNEQKRMDIITNNMANTDTTGFKKEGVTAQAFDEVMADRLKDFSTPGIDPHRIGNVSLGVKIGEVYTDWSEGPLKNTNNVYDFALTDRGFFTISYTDKEGVTSTMYTRDGNFELTSTGFLVTQDGDFVLGTDGNAIQLNPLLETSIDDSGTLYQNGTRVAQLQITDFADYDYLEKYGENFYRPVEGATLQDADAKVLQGYLETSNVNTVTEMVNLIAISRNYETNQKLIQTYDDSLQITANQIGKL